jgi:nitroreductase
VWITRRACSRNSSPAGVILICCLFLPDKTVPREVIDEALALAMRAPSNCNVRPRRRGFRRSHHWNNRGTLRVPA